MALSSYNMYRVELPPTRITPTSQTSIDCVCINLVADELNVKVLNTCISDHTGQICEVTYANTDQPPAPSTKRRHITNRNLLKLKNTLQQENWNEVYNTLNPNDAYNIFNLTLQQALNHACPLVDTRQKKKKSPSINDPVAEDLRQQFLRVQEMYLKSSNEDHKRRALTLKKDYDLRLRSIRAQSNIAKIRTQGGNLH